MTHCDSFFGLSTGWVQLCLKLHISESEVAIQSQRQVAENVVLLLKPGSASLDGLLSKPHFGLTAPLCQPVRCQADIVPAIPHLETA